MQSHLRLNLGSHPDSFTNILLLVYGVARGYSCCVRCVRFAGWIGRNPWLQLKAQVYLVTSKQGKSMMEVEATKLTCPLRMRVHGAIWRNHLKAY
jgi:hypothetical protein